MPGVFISYRRDDSSAYAGRLYDHLCTRFGPERVFMDVDTIRPGEDFVQAISDRVASCDALIVVIGRRWLTSADATGARRLDDANDFVRLEIASALECKVRVIPALVDGAQMPGPRDLPPDLAPLSRRNAIEISNTLFRQSMELLIQALEEAVQPGRFSFFRKPKVRPQRGPEQPRPEREQRKPDRALAGPVRAEPAPARAVAAPVRAEPMLPLLAAGLAFFFIQVLVGSLTHGPENLMLTTLLQGVALFAILRAPFLGEPLDQLSVLKLTGVWLSIALLKALIGSAAISPEQLPPYFLAYRLSAGATFFLLALEAAAALLFGSLVRFVWPGTPWSAVWILTRTWALGRLAVWLLSLISAQTLVWALYDALVGASILWMVRQKGAER
jgi:hypothetical protein